MNTRLLTLLALFVLLSACTERAGQPSVVATNADASPSAAKLSRVTLSHAPGFHDQPFSVRLSHPDPDATIYYTLDGSDPEPANTKGSSYQYKNLYSYRTNDPFGPYLEHRFQTHRYTRPISVTDRSTAPDRYSQINTTILSGLPKYFPAEVPLSFFKQWMNHRIESFNGWIAAFNGWWVDSVGIATVRVPAVPLFQPPQPRHLLKATVVRAAAFKNGQALGPETVASYFIMPRSTFQLPVVSLVAPEERLFGYEKGILVAGETHDRFRQENPTQQRALGNAPANWMLRGSDAEIPAHLQYFSDKSEPERASVDQTVGMRVHGGTSRGAHTKSLRLYARKQYGNATLEHAFFEEKQKYKRLLLRNSGNDFRVTMMRDAAIQQIMTGMRFDVQAYQPTVVFLNGEYWGLLNLREYMDKHFLSRVHQVDADRLDVMDLDKADEGDDQHWRALMAYVNANPLEKAHHYDHVAGQIDIDSFIDYIIANVFVVNYDWPHNNVRYWRHKVDPSSDIASSGNDGRWRWLMFDTDAGFRDFAPDALLRLVAENPRHNSRTSELFRALLKNPHFVQAFVARFSDLLNTNFKVDRMASVIGSVRAGIEAEMPRHIQRWAFPVSMEAWEKGVSHLQTFARHRPQVQRKQLANFFKLPGDYRLTVNVSGAAHGRVRVNSTVIDARTPGADPAIYPWSGTYFQQVPLGLEALPAPCFEFSHWEGDVRTTPQIALSPAADLNLTAIFRRVCASP